MPIVLVALLLLVVAPPAFAGERVLVVKDGEIEARWDRHLPPDPEPLTPDPPRAVPSVGPSVKDALARARKRGAISKQQHTRYARIYNEARAVFSRRSVERRCRVQLGRVLGVVQTLARRDVLTAGRMPPLFLQLRRNTEFWQREPRVRLGERVEFEGDPLLFQHYEGYGLQIQPLGNAGKANGLWTACQERPEDCKRRKLNRLLESLLRVRSWRAGAKAWEYWFPFGGGYPPWTSGMAQATAMQALSRGAVFFAEPRFMDAARKALPLFRATAPAGVRKPMRRGVHYVLYSFAPQLRVLNAFLQAITGLHDYAKLSGDRRARRLFRQGDRWARRQTPRYDTGKWSYYALPDKSLASLDYHVLVTGFLENLCERTGARVYCRTARRFARYTEKRGGPPPRPPRDPKPGPRCGAV